MPYNLIITAVDGVERTSLRSPYASREDTARTVRIIVADGSPEAEQSFADIVVSAPLGKTLRHRPTGVAFRTEEA